MIKSGTLSLVFFSMLFSTLAIAQDDSNKNKNILLGVSAQVYPAGLITTINAEKYLTNTTSLVFRVGGNFINRRDLSPENDNEKGMGFGGSMGFRKHFPLKKNKIAIAFHTDIWNTWIDWKNYVLGAPNTSGKTYALVVQPWLEGGYFFEFNNSSEFGISLGFGREINVITNGKNVGQGWMGSLVFQYQFALD